MNRRDFLKVFAGSVVVAPFIPLLGKLEEEVFVVNSDPKIIQAVIKDAVPNNEYILSDEVVNGIKTFYIQRL